MMKRENENLIIKQENDLFVNIQCKEEPIDPGYDSNYLTKQPAYPLIDEKNVKQTCCDLKPRSKKRKTQVLLTSLFKTKVFYCRICNRQFKQKAVYEEHLKGHIERKPEIDPEKNSELAVINCLSSLLNQLEQRTNVNKDDNEENSNTILTSVKDKPLSKPLDNLACIQKGKFLGTDILIVLPKIEVKRDTAESIIEKKDERKLTATKTLIKKENDQQTILKPFLCVLCPKTFRNQSNLKKHYRTHSGVKPFECDQCFSRFATNYHLKRHARIHTGEKPFSCTVCTKAFTRNSTLKQHLKTHDK